MILLIIFSLTLSTFHLHLLVWLLIHTHTMKDLIILSCKSMLFTLYPLEISVNHKQLELWNTSFDKSKSNLLLLISFNFLSKENITICIHWVIWDFIYQMHITLCIFHGLDILSHCNILLSPRIRISKRKRKDSKYSLQKSIYNVIHIDFNRSKILKQKNYGISLLKTLIIMIEISKT